MNIYLINIKIQLCKWCRVRTSWLHQFEKKYNSKSEEVLVATLVLSFCLLISLENACNFHLECFCNIRNDEIPSMNQQTVVSIHHTDTARRIGIFRLCLVVFQIRARIGLATSRYYPEYVQGYSPIFERISCSRRTLV